MDQEIDPQHSGAQATLRVAGPVTIVVGVVLLIVGATRMFGFDRGPTEDPGKGFIEGRRSFDEVVRRSHDDFDSRSRSSFAGFGIAALGMVCLAGGVAMTRYGYMGRVARYVAEEMAPVAKDTLNYMAEGAEPGVTAVARAVASGIAQGVHPSGGPAAAPACPACGLANEPGASFCSGCGAALDTPCPGCGQHNKPGARFCNHCGKALE